MNKLLIQREKGGLSRALPGEDHISGLLVMPGEINRVPSGMNLGEFKVLGSIEDLERLGFNKEDGTNNEIYCHYHVSEFFRMNPGSQLWFGYQVYVGADKFRGVLNMCRAARGKIRQLAVACPDLVFDAEQVGFLQTMANLLEEEDMPAVILYTSKIMSLTALSADLRVLNAPKVSVVIGQDGGGLGKELFLLQGRSISCIGNALGCLSKAQVHESIAWVQKFNVASGELGEPGFVDGTMYEELSRGLLEDLSSRGYIYLRRYNGIGGTYYNDTHVCAPIANNDYAYIEANRTMDKAIRGVRSYLLPQLNGPIKVDAGSGKLDSAVVSSLETLAGRALEQMERDGELSGYRVVIDPDQDVLSSGQLVVKIVQVPIGVMRTIVVKIGFSTKLG